MKAFTLGILVVLLSFSCSKNNENKISSKSQTDSKPKNIQKSIFPDFINLSETDFEKFEKGKNSKLFQYKNQKLYFVPYTDYSITTLILTNEILKDKNLIGLLKAEKIIVEDTINAIKTTEFITDKKIKLDVSKSFVEKIYGKSDSIITKNGTEILFWNFLMNENRKDYVDGNLKPFVHNGLGFSAEMTFKNDSLKTLIYKYDIP